VFTRWRSRSRAGRRADGSRSSTTSRAIFSTHGSVSSRWSTASPHLKLSQPKRQTKEPLFYADHISLQLLWGSLLTGHLVARVDARGVKAVLEQPAPGTAPRLPDLATLIPVKIVLDRLQAKDGEVLYVWVHQKYRPTVWFHDIEATLENLGSRPNLTAGPMTLSAAGIVQRKGRMSVVVRQPP
jgi:hypothetical protein